MNDAVPVLVETTSNGFVQRWFCPPPPQHIWYTVTKSYWPDYRTRDIYEWRESGPPVLAKADCGDYQLWVLPSCSSGCCRHER